MSPTAVASASKYFKALADPKRLELLYLVAEQRQCSLDLAMAARITPATVTHHMKKLVEMGLVTRFREGKYTYYEVTSDFETIDRIITEL